MYDCMMIVPVRWTGVNRSINRKEPREAGPTAREAETGVNRMVKSSNMEPSPRCGAGAVCGCDALRCVALQHAMLKEFSAVH